MSLRIRVKPFVKICVGDQCIYVSIHRIDELIEKLSEIKHEVEELLSLRAEYEAEELKAVDRELEAEEEEEETKEESEEETEEESETQ
jgi:uncharacterized membrane protein YukC